MSLKDNAAITLSVIVLCCSTLTLGQFIGFLSSHSPLTVSRYSLFGQCGRCGLISSQSFMDFFLVCVFVLQHSLQNHKLIKEFLNNCGYGDFERLLYNLGTCFALQALMHFWQPIPTWVVWKISTSNQPIAWWIFTITHIFAWLQIYSGCYIMDLTELLGAKQVFHSIQGWPEPLSLKSEGLRRFYSHMRHPSFSAMAVILFVHPVMQIDRLFLAYGFVIYMIMRTKVDDIDYAYQRRMLQRKERDLSCNE